jgi:hypothetical protein
MAMEGQPQIGMMNVRTQRQPGRPPYWCAPAARKWQRTFTAYETSAAGWDGRGRSSEDGIGFAADVYARHWCGARSWSSVRPRNAREADPSAGSR